MLKVIVPIEGHLADEKSLCNRWPDNAYSLRKIESSRTINFDIIIAINTDLYDPEDFIFAVKNIVYPLSCDRMFVANDNFWVFERD